MSNSNIRKIEKKIRKRYRNLLIIWLVVAFVIGMLGGILLVRQTPALDKLIRPKYEKMIAAEATPTPVPTATPSPVPTPKSTPEPTKASAPVVLTTMNVTTINIATPTPIPSEESTPVQDVQDEPIVTETKTPVPMITATPEPLPTATPVPVEVKATATPEAARLNVNVIDDYIIPYGLSYTFETEVLADGYPRYTAADTDYETAKITMMVQQYLTPSYYALHYASQYRLKGDEAGVEFTLNMSDLSTAAGIDPQNALVMNFVTENGTVVRGYKLMDAAIAGKYNVSLKSKEKATYYKRFSYTQDMGEIAFLQVIYYQGGQEKTLYFSLIPDAYTVEQTGVGTISTYPTLQRGDKGADVRMLQLKLIEEGFMEDEADSQYGRITEDAVKLAQKIYGMKETGIADDAFQQKLYGE